MSECDLALYHIQTAGRRNEGTSFLPSGYSVPYIRRQRNLPPAADQQLPPSQGNSSVWIDPAVSAFLMDGQAGQVAYTQSNLQPRSQHQPKKPQSVSSSLKKGPVTPIPPR